jgi:hypothetical protein
MSSKHSEYRTEEHPKFNEKLLVEVMRGGGDI